MGGLARPPAALGSPPHPTAPTPSPIVSPMVDAITRWGRILARSTCSSCGQPLPLPWLTDRIACPYCHTDQVLPQRLWQGLLRELDEHSDRGDPREATATEGARTVVYTLGPGVPRCERCDAPYPVAALHPDEPRNFACVQCGDPASAAPVPPWIRGPVGPARQVVAVLPRPELPGGGAAALSPADEPRPVAMACPSCGGGLQITAASARLLGCRYCGSDVYIPDDLWRRLHPVKKVEPFYVGFAGPSLWRRRVDAERRAAEERHERALEDERRRAAEAEAAHRARLAAAAAAGARAWRAALLFAALLLGAGAVVWTTPAGALEPGLIAGGALTVVVSALVTCAYVTRPIALATGHPGEWQLFATWFWVPFALLMPMVGSLMAAIRALILLRGRFGAARIASGSTARDYPATALHHGEGRPAALFFLLLAVAWPLLATAATAPDLLAVAFGRAP